jgi:hypothetical protein
MLACRLRARHDTGITVFHSQVHSDA